MSTMLDTLDIIEDILNERLVELKYESYQEVYYIDKAIIRITIKYEINQQIIKR